jgi:hypothetical protein
LFGGSESERKINKKKHDSARENLNFNSHEWDTKHHLILNAIEKQTAQQHLGARDKPKANSSSNGSGETGIFCDNQKSLICS